MFSPVRFVMGTRLIASGQECPSRVHSRDPDGNCIGTGRKLFCCGCKHSLWGGDGSVLARRAIGACPLPDRAGLEQCPAAFARLPRPPVGEQLLGEVARLPGFVQGTFGYQSLSMNIPFGAAAQERVATDWRSRGIDLGAGLEYAVSEHWTLTPRINIGVAELSNKADYGDSALGAILQPLFEGIVFDWDTRASVVGAAVGAHFDREYEAFRLLARFSASANHVRSFDESSADITISDTASALDFEANTVHPLGLFRERPVSLVTVIGATTLVGGARGELGFDEFAEFGLALQFDLGDNALGIPDLRVGLKTIQGPDVSGWSVIIGRGL